MERRLGKVILPVDDWAVILIYNVIDHTQLAAHGRVMDDGIPAMAFKTKLSDELAFICIIFHTGNAFEHPRIDQEVDGLD